jgi:two-component system sensor histidine kinase PilS (NtrC family)
VIAFLADTSALAERVQQSKLAALGRLSASIAHEIRNPVGAMSHAAQLLAETLELGVQEKRLTEIITTNAERVSTIITNVMQLSRRETTRPERLFVGDWMREFLTEFTDTLQLDPALVHAVLPNPDIEVRVDPTHLRQIVWNLCENAIRHSAEMPGAPPIDLLVARFHSSGRPFLEVADRGPGIPDESAERIFEPFFSGRRGGTGLGLFIARELAQCNGALLLYEPRGGGGSIFRIVFADPSRWEGRADG